MRVEWIAIVQILALSGGLLAAEADRELDAKTAKALKVRWLSVRYDKSVVVENPEIVAQATPKSEKLTLSCQVEIRDPGQIVAVSREGVVTQMIDSEGREVAVHAPQASLRNSYGSLRYARQSLPPSPPAKWRTLLRAILQLPPPPSGPREVVMELQPCQVSAGIDVGVLDRAGGELQTIRGYFHAILPGSMETVEVPFKPNSAWARLTPDTEIQVQEAVSEQTSFSYRIEARPAGPTHPLLVGDSVPTRCVVSAQLIDEDGKPLRYVSDAGWFPAHIGGWGSGSGSSVHPIKSIRFLIAVNARECRIPFELKHVSLPKP